MGRKGVDVLLKKKVGVREAEKLRAVCLFEADANNNAKILSRQTMQQAISLQSLAPEQYGSRSDKSAITQAENKLLMLDYIRM